METAKNDTRKYVVLLLCLLVFLTFFPLLKAGFTDHESMYAALRVWSEESYFGWVGQLAKQHGRWNYYVTYALQSVPFLIREFWYYKLVSITSMIGCFALFAYVLGRVLDSRRFGLLGAVVFLACLQNTTDHSLLTGYFISHQVITSLLMLSFLFFHLHLERSNRGLLVVSAVCYFATMSERSVLYFPIFVIMALSRGDFGNKRELLRRTVRALSLHFVVVGLWVGAFVAYRLVHPSQYGGNLVSLQTFSFVDCARVIYQLSISAFPLCIFFDSRYAELFHHYSHAYEGHSYNIWHILAHARPEWVVRAVISAFLVLVILRKANGEASVRKCLVASVAGLILLFAPTALLGLTQAYQQRIRDGLSISMHVTHMSYFGVVLLIAAAVSGVLRFLRDRGWVGIRAIFVAATVAATALVCLCTDYANHHIATSQGMMRQKWRTMDLFFETDVFASVPEGSVMYAPSLWGSPRTAYYTITNYSGSHLVREKDGESYWSKYAQVCSGKAVSFTDDRNQMLKQLADGSADVYYLRYLQEPKDPEQFLVFSKISEVPQDSGRLYGDSLDLFSHSKNKTFVVNLAFRAPIRRVLVDGRQSVWVHDNHAALPVNKLTDTSPMLHTLIEAPGIDLDSVSLSHYLDNEAPCYADKLPVFPAETVFEEEDTFFGTGTPVAGLTDASGLALRECPMRFAVNVEENGLYKLTLRVARDLAADAKCRVQADAERLRTWPLEFDSRTWRWEQAPFAWGFKKGIHAIAVLPKGGPGSSFLVDQLKLERAELDESLPSKMGFSEVSLTADSVRVRGWALSAKPITRVAVRLNGEVLGRAEYGLRRPDIYKKHSEYMNEYGGFEFKGPAKPRQGEENLVECAVYSGQDLLSRIEAAVEIDPSSGQ